MTTRDSLRSRILALIERPDVALRDTLLADLATYQAARVPAYGRLVRTRGAEAALPTDVFRFTRVAAHSPDRDIRTFRTSGTTRGARGIHSFADLSLYDAAAETTARAMLFADVERMPLVILAPPAAQALDSSLSYMLDRFVTWFASEATYVWPLDSAALQEAMRTDQPVAVLGTSFAFVEVLDANDDCYALPAGSRVMQTGGFKGRSREIEPAAMRQMLSSRFGIPATHVVAEYGMTELSSQAYETTLVDRGARRLRFPVWVRTSIVDPATLRPVMDGPGLLRIDDPANLDSVCMLQTADMARRIDDGFELLGRAPGSVARGCSLAIEEAIGS